MPGTACMFPEEPGKSAFFNKLNATTVAFTVVISYLLFLWLMGTLFVKLGGSKRHSHHDAKAAVLQKFNQSCVYILLTLLKCVLARPDCQFSLF